jgi:cap2 methyltransferase
MEFDLTDRSTRLSCVDFLRFQQTLKDDLNRMRQQIDKLRERGLGKQFGYAVRYVNPYEDLNVPNLTISSRAFFKMYELIIRFNLLKIGSHLKTLHLCEAPGSFVEATQEYIRRHRAPSTTHEWYGVTLREGLEWTSDSSHVIYANIITDELPEQVRQSILVTGDGGFEIDDNVKNDQEVLNTPLLKGQIRHAVESVAIGGSIVIKMFDLFELETCKLLWSCYGQFKKLYLAKPFGSRICNSEKYIVGVGFQSSAEHNLQNHVEQQGTEKNTQHDTNIPDWFYGALWNANRRLVQLQMQSLSQAIKLAESRVDTRSLNYSKKKEQCEKCLRWMGFK